MLKKSEALNLCRNSIPTGGVNVQHRFATRSIKNKEEPKPSKKKHVNRAKVRQDGGGGAELAGPARKSERKLKKCGR